MEKCYNSQVLNKSNKPNNLSDVVVSICMGIVLIVSTYNLVYVPYHEPTLTTFGIWWFGFFANVILLYINSTYNNKVYLILIPVISLAISITILYTSPKKPIINFNSKSEKACVINVLAKTKTLTLKS